MSGDGYFTSPNSLIQTYSMGDMMHISWVMTGGSYTSFDLYLVTGQLFANSISIRASASKPWYKWKVDPSNLSLPFLFRIFHANGTMEDNHTEGFESAQFWITPGSTSAFDVSPSTILMTSTTTSFTANVAPTSSSPSESGIAGKLGIGVGAGLAIGLALVSSVASIYLWRRRSRVLSVHEKLLDESSQWSGSKPPSRARSPLPKKPVYANHEGRSPLLQKAVHSDYDTRPSSSVSGAAELAISYSGPYELGEG